MMIAMIAFVLRIACERTAQDAWHFHFKCRAQRCDFTDLHRSSKMLVLSRKPSEAVVLVNKFSMDMIAIVFVTEAKAARTRLGFYVDQNVLIFRNELTNFAGMSFEELSKIPIGTRVMLKDKE
jgi:sRNA-binding carbon storage regulator CsrA